MKIDNLSAEAKRHFYRLRREWGIKDHAGQFLLHRAMEAYDEMRAAQKLIAEEGMIVSDPHKGKKLHPACQREKEARAHMLQALKMLELDLESLMGK